MKTIYIFLLLALTTIAASAQTVTIATVSITNTPSGIRAQTITVNGITRTWTNNVFSAQNQIQAGADGLASWTNLFAAYAAVPQSGFTITASASTANNLATNVVFRSLPGMALTVSIGNSLPVGWGTVVFSSQTLTPATVVRVPTNAVGWYEKSNVVNGLIDYIKDPTTTNYFPLGIWALHLYTPIDYFSTFVGITNLIQTHAISNTNYTQAHAISLTNYVDDQGAIFTNLFNALGSAAFTPIERYQPGCDVLSNLCALGPGFLSGLSYIENPNNILLEHTNRPPDPDADTERLRANWQGDFWLYFESGNVPFLHADTSHDVYLLDHNGTARFESQGVGKTIIRSFDGVDALTLGLSDTPLFVKPVVGNAGQIWGFPSMGSVSNYLTSAASGSSPSSINVHSFNVPPNTVTNNGDSIIRTIGVTFSANNNTKQTQVQFNGTPIFDTGAIANTGSGSVSITCEVTRINGPDNSATVTYRCEGTADATSVTSHAQVGTISGVDFTSNVNFYIVLTAGSGGGTGDFQVILDNTKFVPGEVWRTMTF